VEKKFFTKAKGIGGKIKRRYSDFIVEELAGNGKKCSAEFFLREENGKKGQGETRGEMKIPEGRKDFLLLEMEKCNTETNLAVKTVARALHKSQKSIGYAGLKDKRAVTCQRISVFMPSVKQLEKFSARGIVLRNPEWSDSGIDLGDLNGNYFTVKIRDIPLSGEEIKKRGDEAFGEMEKGIPNYFGEQRFGSIRQISHLVGREIIREDIKSAVMLYLTAISELEEKEVKEARLHLAESSNFKQAEREFPIKYRYERAMAHYLANNRKDFFGAFSILPRRLRFLFTHAYQSHLFNRLVEKRLGEGLFEPLEGEPQEDGIPMGLLPGYNSAFSPGRIGELERELLEKEGITFADFKLEKMKECSCQGARRKIFFFPREMKLLEIGEDEFFEGKRKCKVSFYLDKGCYATVLLSELMKPGKEGTET